MQIPALLASLLSLSSLLHAQSSLIPLPASYQELPGQPFTLSAQTAIIAKPDAQAEAQTLAQTLRTSTGLPLPIQSAGTGITLILKPELLAKFGEEGYSLVSSNSAVTIEAATPTGLFYGGRSLLQLLPPQALAKQASPHTPWTVPAVAIADQPRFPWRGFMLDEARQFFGKNYVLKLLDAMALHKLNRFHWHLTDDEGWRIEILSYPKLTSIGAWRGTDCPLPNPRKETHLRYGGFYTQQDIREIVAYAKSLHIEIMPEIDLPGHALAITTAYPELLPNSSNETVSAQGFKANAISPAKPETYQFIDQVISEIKSLFPYPYIHIGGDEVNHNAWKDCPQIQQLMQQHQLKNLHEVQVHFTRQLESILAKHDKKIFGWNEVLDPKLNRQTGIMSWIGTDPGISAANQGFPVVMAPGQHCYFDMGYPGAEGEPPSHWWAGPVDCARAYSFDPLADSANLSADAKNRILGVHAALWTEFVSPYSNPILKLPTYQDHADYKIWPRLAAIAEVAWTPQASRSYSNFEQRLNPSSLGRLDALNIHYRIPVPTASHKNGKVTLKPAFANAETRYTLDGTTPTANSALATTEPIPLNGTPPNQLRARTFLNQRASTVLSGSTAEASASWNSTHLNPSQAAQFDLTDDLNSPGIWRATFSQKSGSSALTIAKVEILVNQTPIATDSHPATLNAKNTKHTWRLNLPNLPANAKVTLRAQLTGQNGTDSSGTITLTKSNQLEPDATTVTTSLKPHQTHTPELAADWNPDTFFWINSQPNPDDTVTWTFPQPLTVQFIECLTGQRNATKDQAVGAILEYSTDATTWQKAADYAYGNASATLAQPTAIKALRIRFTAKQPNWIIINDPTLR